jgi:hypothetical protein
MRIFDRRWALPILLSAVVGCGSSAMVAREAGSPAAEPPPPPAPAVSLAAVASPAIASPGGGKEESTSFSASSAKAPPPGPKGAPPQPTQGDAQPVQKQQAIIIYSATLNMAVFEVEPSMKRIEELAKGMGGFLAKREDQTIIIRVPAERFEEAMRGIERIGDMLHKNIVAEDVTEEFRDLEVRLKGSKAVQERLTQLLSKATKVEESIAIERELDRVTMEIDRIEGRMKFLRDRAAFSTITVTFQPKASESASPNAFKLPTPWLGQLGLGRLFQL